MSQRKSKQGKQDSKKLCVNMNCVWNIIFNPLQLKKATGIHHLSHLEAVADLRVSIKNSCLIQTTSPRKAKQCYSNCLNATNNIICVEWLQ